ncbi:MAG: DUF4124 domain-containing protein [Gammaproteobacteria bacterium]|nr:DUF4124 domain-containing protein [Gammaproteobacteria bacterium]MDE2023602.1 DUF4124 domain-containing protein [Gammaproteobacteria bacterium]MDE2139091.1 DUF4124 domain-containing protein [Gammaproteobacteria bacterium]MDE2273916.1 DUF4124 domain-containing protein [Gammaproteobacteria bacterium]
MNLKHLLPVLMVPAVLAFSAAQAQQVYRWVDAQGNVHYSQTPPPAGATKAKVIEVAPPPPDPTGVAEQQQLVKSVAAADAAQQKAAQEAAQAAAKKAQQQQACDAARKQLQAYMDTHRVITNSTSASPAYYTGDDLVKLREQTQQQVNKTCAGT